MPSRNIIKIYGVNQFYHAYNRGVAKMPIFHEQSDYNYLLSLFKRHLSHEPVFDRYGRPYEHYADRVKLVAYCLMPNHYHLLFYLSKSDGIEKLMRSVMTAYSGYFNRKYNRVGKLFQGAFKASSINSEPYLAHISRYIHLNPIDIGQPYETYQHSSLFYFLGKKQAEWLKPKLARGEMTISEYKEFMSEYLSTKEALDEIKHELADC